MRHGRPAEARKTPAPRVDVYPDIGLPWRHSHAISRKAVPHGARASACDRRFRDGPRAVLSGCGARAERSPGARLPLPRGGPHLLRLRPTMRPVQLRLLDDVRHRARRRLHSPRRPHQLVGVQQADHQLGDQVARGARSDRALLCGGQPAEQDRGVHGCGPLVRRALHRARPGCRAPRVLLARPRRPRRHPAGRAPTPGRSPPSSSAWRPCRRRTARRRAPAPRPRRISTPGADPPRGAAPHPPCHNDRANPCEGTSA